MDKKKLKELAEDERFISGIYNYCDRWCERCPQTSRCLNYAMGEEESADPEARDISNTAFWEKMAGIFQDTLELLNEMAESSGIDLNEIDLEEAEEERASIRETAENHAISRAARTYSDMVEDWFRAVRASFKRDDEEDSRPLFDKEKPEESDLQESLEVIRWYQHQIYVKMMRAISGRMREESAPSDQGESFAKDSDGSTKVALIGIDRSLAAWSIIDRSLPSFGGNDVKTILNHLERLRRTIEKDFPDARGFIRPGFDRIDYNS